MRVIFVFLFFLFVISNASAQEECLPEGVNFNNQSDLDNFPSDYPGCKVILGDLSFNSPSSNLFLDSLIYLEQVNGDLEFFYADLVGLGGLNNIQRVGGQLNVQYSNLQDFIGLDSLRFVGNGVRISSNEQLESLDGLNKIDSIYGDKLQISSNPQLVNLEGLNGLEYTWALEIRNNLNLQNLQGLDSLKKIDYQFKIKDNPRLINLQGLNNLDSVMVSAPFSSFQIINNDSLANLSGMENFEYLQGLLIRGNELLESLEGFPTSATFNEIIEIHNNSSLLNLDGMGEANYLYGMLLRNNPALVNIDGLSGLDSLGSRGLFIDSCNALLNIDGLSNIELARGWFKIYNCESLNSIFGLEGISFIENDILLYNCPQLTSLDGLNNLEYAERLLFSDLNITDFDPLANLDSCYSLTISRLDLIENLSGFENFKKANFLVIGGVDDEIQGNLNILNLEGLENLIEIGSLQIGYNPNLANLDALSNVRSISFPFYGLRIENNESLNSINGLWNVSTGNIEVLSIENNPLLSECSIDIVCENVNSPFLDAYIENNGAGCNSEEEVLEGCSGFCYYNGIFISSQQDLIDFIDYNEECQIISGNLEITGSVYGLSELSNIVEVRGSIKIHDCSNLVDLNGLDNISNVYDIQIENNSNLIDISGLNGVNSNGLDSIIIRNNSELSDCSINAFCSYYLEPGSTVIIETNSLGCYSIAEFQENCFGLMADLIFTSQDEIDEFINDCINCEVINGSVLIEGADITNLDGLSNIDFILGDLNIGGITGNPILTSISGLNNLQGVNGDLIINNNSILNSLEGVVQSESALQLNNLIDLGANLEITNNSSLENLVGLESLETINGDIIISGNSSLMSLSGIDNIDPESIMGVFIDNNAELSLCSVLSVCNYLEGESSISEIFANTDGCNTEAEVNSNCIGVGIEEQVMLRDLVLYPNPVDNTLFIEGMEERSQIRIYNQLGELLLSKSNISSIDVSNLQSGVYFIDIESGGTHQKRKIVKR